MTNRPLLQKISAKCLILQFMLKNILLFSAKNVYSLTIILFHCNIARYSPLIDQVMTNGHSGGVSPDSSQLSDQVTCDWLIVI